MLQIWAFEGRKRDWLALVQGLERAFDDSLVGNLAVRVLQDLWLVAPRTEPAEDF
jgi:hypothetical protein